MPAKADQHLTRTQKRRAQIQARIGRAEVALETIKDIIEAVPSYAWEAGETDNHPLWQALDAIDELVMKTLAPEQFDGSGGDDA
jgi:hypothetical protein